jgi:hypothetical protein
MRSFVWSESHGLSLIEDWAGRPFYASSINDSGIVIGEADDENGIRRAMIWSADSGLRQMHVPFSFHPACIDNQGNVVGRDSATPWTRAWLVLPSGASIELPAGPNHNVQARRIVGNSIFGHARGTGWKHVHPIRWDFELQVSRERNRAV